MVKLLYIVTVCALAGAVMALTPWIHGPNRPDPQLDTILHNVGVVERFRASGGGRSADAEHIAPLIASAQELVY